MRVYVVEIQEPRQEVEYHYYPTLSEALKMKPSVGPDELNDVYQDSKIRTYEIVKGLTRKQLVFGLLNEIGFAKPGSHKTLRRWDGKRWAKESEG